MADLHNIKSQNLQDLIKQQIKYYIVNSNLKKGDPLPSENVLSEKLGISRTAIRESLKGLQAVGLVHAVQGKGYFVQDFNLEALLNNLPYMLEMYLTDFRDILEIRIVLESHYLTKLIMMYTQEDINRLKSILAELAEKNLSGEDLKDVIDIHSRFHCELYRHSENKLLMNLIKIFSTIQKNLTLLKRYATSDPTSFIEHHQKILDAIESRDAVLAGERLISHFGEAIEWVKNNSE
ncbi:MAG: FadR family transcriptional regulator, partial [Candidatus Atribacteria bacterium]|nr:FadR family transcriptional regulator [Candidatus Atribacteria bacterium]